MQGVRIVQLGLWVFLVVAFGACAESDSGAVEQEPTVPQPDPTQEATPSFLYTDGSKLVNDRGEEVRLTGINWFGFETSVMLPHGLWQRNHDEMLGQVVELGFNSLRIPFSNDMVRSERIVDTVDPTLEGLTPMEAMDVIIGTAGDLGLKVVLDNHSRAADGYLNESLWYTDDVSEDTWIADWVMLAERYRDNDTVVAFDLNNEPHGEATWGAGAEATDWDAAATRCAEAVHAVNPDVLIIVEGVQTVNNDWYWWGGNLRGVLTDPIVLSIDRKLVYSAHEYGPEIYEQAWFSDASFPENLNALWDYFFGFIMQEELGHVYMGEFGIKDELGADGRALQWFERFMAYIGPSYSWAFWCLNPNSADTGGILMDDWETVHRWKVDALTPFMAPMIE